MIPFQDSHVAIIILLCFTNAFSGIAVGGFGVNHADLGPKYTGSIVGFAGGIGIPIPPAKPTIDPVYFGPKSAWLTPKPPTAIPLKAFVKHNKIIIATWESWNGIIERQVAPPRKPIVFTVFLTLNSLNPFLIRESAR